MTIIILEMRAALILIVHFDENMLIGDAADLDAFMEMYGVEAISKEYL